MKITSIITISLFILTGATFAGPIAKAPPARPIAPPISSDAGWYWGLNGGYLWLNDASGCGCTELNFDSGWGAHGVVGYRFDNGISLGLSSGYLNGKYDVLQGGQYCGEADLDMVPITLNATYTCNLTESLLFYIGGGLGTAWSELHGAGVDGDSGEWNFAWQGRAGFGYKVNSDVILNLGYRYIDIEDAMGEFGDARGHMAEAGFKINF